MLKYQGVTIDGEAVELEVRNGRIASRRAIERTSGLPRLFPGLVDLQHNGALGHSYNNLADRAEEELECMAGHLLRHGVVRVQATFTTADYAILETAARAIDKALTRNAQLASLFPGIFHEGVFISPLEGWRGGHLPEYILPPDWERFHRLDGLSGGRIRTVNLAPEQEGALEFIRHAVEAGHIVALGHCTPDTETIHRAADAGASMVTHFANGAAPTIHRFHNPFWGFLAEKRLRLGLIGDGFHLPPEVVYTALACKGQDGCFMVSDANVYSGRPPGTYPRNGGLPCVVEPDGLFHVQGSREILAGAWFQLDRCVEFLQTRCALPLEDAWRLCSIVPANIVGFDLPMLQEGNEATFVILQNGKIQQTIFNGDVYA